MWWYFNLITYWNPQEDLKKMSVPWLHSRLVKLVLMEVGLHTDFFFLRSVGYCNMQPYSNVPFQGVGALDMSDPGEEKFEKSLSVGFTVILFQDMLLKLKKKKKLYR
jgi:hypothetical protein